MRRALYYRTTAPFRCTQQAGANQTWVSHVSRARVPSSPGLVHRLPEGELAAAAGFEALVHQVVTPVFQTSPGSFRMSIQSSYGPIGATCAWTREFSATDLPRPSVRGLGRAHGSLFCYMVSRAWQDSNLRPSA